MKRPIALAALTLLAACGRGEEQRVAQDTRTFDAQEPPPGYPPAHPPPPPATPPPLARTQSADLTVTGPEVAPTAAPGVAFNYRYAFRLPAAGIAPMQEQHARACEQLGPARCRVTGMRYRVVDEDDIEASLTMKLEPGISRRFAQTGVEAVIRAQGMLTDAEISGTDVGTGIRAAGRNIARTEDELARIEARLRGRISSEERARLEYEAQQLRQTRSAIADSREDQQELLSNTPVHYQYGSGKVAPGFDQRPSLRRSADQAWTNFVDGIGFLLILLVTLLPWAVVAAVIWLAVRAVLRARRRAAPGVQRTRKPETESQPGASA